MSDRSSSSAVPSAKGAAPHGGPKIRRRNRIITSCLECRRRKLKCDRLHPCNHCAKANRDCIFLSPALDSATKGKLNQFKESIDYLEKGLERSAEDPNAPLGWRISPQSSSLGPDGGEGNESTRAKQRIEPIPEDEKNLEPTPLALADVTYDEEGDDIMDDLGVQVGKLRVTERIGGFVRPRFAEEFADALHRNVEPGSSPSPPVEAIDRGGNTPSQSSESNYPYLDPSSEYIAPGSGLLFSSASSEDVSPITFLPSKDFADKLVKQYWYGVHQITRVVHRPSFERQYEQFWREVSQGFEPGLPMQALVFSVLFSAAVSLPSDAAQVDFGYSRYDMIKTFRAACEYSLSRANVLRTTKVMTLQAFVMYIIPLCRSEITRSHAALVSMAIRLAECAGLHRDGTSYGMSPLETHVRRLVWYQLCFLDIRTVEAVGPRPTIRKGEFDTKLPLNVDDVDLEMIVPPNQDAVRFTEMTATRIRFECYEILRDIWVERPLIEKGQASLTGILKKIEEFRESAQKKYLPLFDKSVPIQHYAANLLQQLVCKMHIAILHRYGVSVRSQMPERLANVLWASGLGLLENTMDQDTSPALRPWVWYLGAHHQWQIALLFIVLVTEDPGRPEVDRMWRCLDYVFDLQPNMPRADKFKLTLSTVQFRLEEYQKQRKHRIPTALEQNLGTLGSVRKTTPSSTSNTRRESGSPFLSLSAAQGDPNTQFNAMQKVDAWQSMPRSQRDSTSPYPLNPMTNVTPGIDMVPQPSNQSPFAFQPDMQFANNNANTGGFGSSSGSAFSPGQPFANLDWAELEKLFPLESPLANVNMDTQGAQGQSNAGNDGGMMSMNLFPTLGWPSADGRGTTGFNPPHS